MRSNRREIYYFYAAAFILTQLLGFDAATLVRFCCQCCFCCKSGNVISVTL